MERSPALTKLLKEMGREGGLTRWAKVDDVERLKKMKKVQKARKDKAKARRLASGKI